MGWLFAIALFVVGCKSGDTNLLLASGLFAIAGSIAFAKK